MPLLVAMSCITPSAALRPARCRVDTAARSLNLAPRAVLMVATDERETRVAQAMELPSAAALESRGSARGEGLALLLDDGTRKSHSVAENTAFVTGFFRCTIAKACWPLCCWMAL